MAIDKAIDSAALDAGLLSVANAIRTKGGTSAPLAFPAGFVSAVEAITAGGGGSSGLAYDMGEFVLAADVKHHPIVNGGFSHSLGEKPDFVLIWTDDYKDLSADNVASSINNVGYIWLNGLTGLPQRIASTVCSDYGVFVGFDVYTGTYCLRIVAPGSVSYMLDENYVPTTEKFMLPVIGGNNYWRAGVTYKYFVSKAWWNVGGVASAE